MPVIKPDLTGNPEKILLGKVRISAFGLGRSDLRGPTNNLVEFFTGETATGLDHPDFVSSWWNLAGIEGPPPGILWRFPHVPR